MSDSGEEKSVPPEVRTIRQLVRLMHRYDLTAIDVVEGERKIRLRRGREAPTAAAGLVQPAPQPAPVAQQAPAPPPATKTDLLVIESPMVGTFYAASSPDAPPFVSVGSSIRPETSVCMIEAMKVYTEIPARLTGTIAEILVKNGQPVEFGQPLFLVSP